MAMNVNKKCLKSTQVKGSGDGILTYRCLEKPRNIIVPYGSKHSTPLQPRRRPQKQHTATGLKKVHSCVTVKENITPNSKCRRSVSLIEFTPTHSVTAHQSSAPEGLETTPCNSEMTPSEHTPAVTTIVPTEQKELALTQRAYTNFILNAWRGRIRKARDYEHNIRQLEIQVDNLNIQTVVLRSLLDSEKNRVAQCFAEVTHCRVRLEEETRQKSVLKSENESKEKEVIRLVECKTDLLTHNENMKNELMTIRKDFNAMELQLTKERDKLSKLREDKKVLLDKVQITEQELKKKSNLLEKLQKENAQLQKEMQEKKGALTLADVNKQEAQVRIFHLEQETDKLMNQINMLKGINNQMENKLQNLELTVQHQNYVNSSMEKLCKEHLMELSKLQFELAKCKEQRWLNCLTKVVSVLLYFPANVIYNIAFPFPLVSTSSNTPS